MCQRRAPARVEGDMSRDFTHQPPDDRIRVARELERAAAISGDAVLRGRALLLHASVHLEQGRFPDARRALQDAEALPLPPEERFEATALKASLLTALGRRQDAVDAVLAFSRAQTDVDFGARARVLAAELMVNDAGFRQEGVGLLWELVREGALGVPAVREVLVPVLEFAVAQEMAPPEFMSEVLARAVGDEELALLRGMTLLRLGRREEAIQVFGEVAQHASDVQRATRALMGLLDALRTAEFHLLRPVCERLEAVAGSGGDVRGLRAGLAFAMARCAGREVAWLERALSHARAALADDEAGFQEALERLVAELEAGLERFRKIVAPDDLVAWSETFLPQDAAPGGTPAEIIAAVLVAKEADEHHPFEALFAIDWIAMTLPSQYLDWLDVVRGPGSMRPEFERALLHVAKARRLRHRGPISCLPQCEPLPNLARDDGERAVAHFIRGRELLESARYTRNTEEAQDFRKRALADVSASIAFAEAAGVPRETLASLRITLGNVHRESGHLDDALAVYEEASLAVTNRGERTRLDKVMADALVARARADDVTRAIGLYERALEGRPGGWLRAETLIALSDAHLAHSETPGGERVRRAHGALVEAARHDEGANAEFIARKRLDLVSQWRRAAPEAREPHVAIEEVRVRFPELADEAARAANGFVIGLDAETMDCVSALMMHPAASIVMQCLPRLPASAEWTPDPAMLPAGVSEEEVLRQMRALRITSAEDVKRALAELPREAASNERPGVLVVRALLLATARQLGAADAGKLMDARRAALEGLPGIPEVKIRGYLRAWLATTWSPGNGRGADDDLPSTCAQLELGLEECGPSSSFHADLVQMLAHFTWQRTDGDRPGHLARARALYQGLLALGERTGSRQTVTQALNGLAAVTAQSGHGAREQRLGGALSTSLAAVAAAGGPERAPVAASNFAWDLTCLVARVRGAERRALLQRACALFDAALQRMDDASIPISIRSNRTVARAALLVELGRPADAIVLHRALLRSINRGRNPTDWATAAHNLAIRLDAMGTRDAWSEAQRLYTAALAHRSVDRFPREHWETALASAATCLGPLGHFDRQRLEVELGTSTVSLRAFAVGRLRSAVAAGRRLGRGAELLDAGNALLDLAATATTSDAITKIAEEGWDALLDALPGMLQHDDSGARIAVSARQVAGALFDAEASRSLLVIDPRVTATLTGDGAMRVLRWMDRSVGVVQRSLALRLDRPDGVGDDCWRRWREALRGGNALAIAEVAEEVRGAAPSFLRLEESMEATWTWLERHRGSAALLPLRVGDAWLVGVLHVRDGRRDGRVVGIDIDDGGLDPEMLWAALRRQHLDEVGEEVVDQWAAVVREMCGAALRWSIDGTPEHLLWVPADMLRWLPPQRVWPGQRVSTGASLALRPWRDADSLKHEVFIAAADPGDLPGSVEGVLELARVAVADHVHVLVGRGARWGRSLAPNTNGVADLPPSPDEVIDALGRAGLTVLLCHGRAERPGDGRLRLLDHTGADAWLDVEALTATVGRLREATILLLSCETGRVAPMPHAVGGLAGALLAAGARAVVAPLVPVSLSIALELAADAVRSPSLDDLPAHVARLRDGAAAPETSTLGRRAPRSDAASPEGRWQRESFIVWIA